MEVGYFLSSEEWGPKEIVDIAGMAAGSGIYRFWISDHYHPWTEEQGSSPFVWGVIGALSRAVPRVRVTTAVTCPTLRIHPAIIAQAAATSAILLEGRFVLGVGSGEALNEHILGTVWPETAVRLEMLEEAVGIMRSLWAGGFVSHYGKHYTVRKARVYDLPDEPVPVYMSAFGDKSLRLARRIADGFITTSPDADSVRSFKKDNGGPAQAGLKVCWAPDEEEARKTAHRIWPNEVLPGELAQELAVPAHFEQASQLVTQDMLGESIPCGPDPEPYVKAIKEYEQAGFDELYLQQIGPRQEEFFQFLNRELRPRL